MDTFLYGLAINVWNRDCVCVSLSSGIRQYCPVCLVTVL